NPITPLTDRTDYLAPMANNVGFALAAEKLMGIEITPRCTVLRVIACEMSRIISHMVWLGTTSIDLGAFTPFLWAFQERERIYDLQEMWTGARLTTSVTRVGGMLADIPDGFTEGLRHFTKTYPKTLSEIDRVLTRNAVWAGRTQNVGVMTAEEAIDYSLSGPMLRASGVPYDVRKDHPYLDYETYEFEVPVGAHGDVYERYLARLQGCHQANGILDQAHPAAVLHQPRGAGEDGGGALAFRPDRHQCLGGHRDGRGGSMSVGAHPARDAGTEAYQPVFDEKTLERLQEILARYPTKQAALLPALWLVQEARGWISDRNMAEVAEVLGLTPAYVKGVVTFYTMYHTHPVGKYFVQVCTTSPCNICGAEAVVNA